MVKKKTVFWACMGFPLGVTISLLITICISWTVGDGRFYFIHPLLVESVGSELGAAALQFFLSGLMGAAFAAGSTVFLVERWSLAKQVALHFVILVGTMLPVAYICYWMEHTLGGVLYYIGLFVVIYLAIWLIQYATIRKKINKINTKLGEK